VKESSREGCFHCVTPLIPGNVTSYRLPFVVKGIVILAPTV